MILLALTMILLIAGCATGSTSSSLHTVAPGSSTRAGLGRAGAHDVGNRDRPGSPASAGLGRRRKTSGCTERGQLPDAACTPGAVFASATLAQICRPGYASSVRDVPERVKRAVDAEYGAGPAGAGYEVDHLAPLELGGSNAIANLWPQPSPGYKQKDQVENELHDAVCAGRIELRRAQLAIARDWRHAGVPVPSAGTNATPNETARTTPRISGGSSAEGSGSTTHLGDGAFCSAHQCIANFPQGRGTVTECADGEWSHSGGLPGVCNRHGGPR